MVLCWVTTQAGEGDPRRCFLYQKLEKGKDLSLVSPHAEHMSLHYKKNHLVFHNPLVVPEREPRTVSKALTTGMLSSSVLF